MEVLSSRTILRPADLDTSIVFYRDTLGLGVYREFGEGDHRGVVFFTGGGYLEVSGSSPGSTPPVSSCAVSLWLQVRDLRESHEELRRRGVVITSGPQRQPWGLDEMVVVDPDGVAIYLIEVPPEHPLRHREDPPSAGTPNPARPPEPRNLAELADESPFLSG